MRTAAADASKATMVATKDRAIVGAAREHFLRDGFAGASMDGIAKSAGVSVKTIYGHFENKNQLFSTVMIAACGDGLLSGAIPSDAVLSERFAWFRDATPRGLVDAGREYLRHLLSAEQLALYRVVTRDADRFPALGVHYHQNVAQGRTRILIAYFRRLIRTNAWAKRDAAKDAVLYEALLRAGVYEEALHGLLHVDAAAIDKQARSSARTMWKVLAGACG